MIELPIDAALPEIVDAIQSGKQLLLEAEPGAGKSTRIAPALARTNRTWLLQPRRVAALGVAQRIAHEQPGWELGREVGYAVRHDRRGNDQTCCWVATDGVVLRQLLHDPLLEHIDCLLFDEFHERSAASELLLSWAIYLQQELRPELRIGILSATMPAALLSQILPQAMQISVPGRCFPVSVVRKTPPLRQRPEPFWADVVRQAVSDVDGDVLVFLPGVGEINRVKGLLSDLEDAGIELLPLHGSLPLEEQARALRPTEHRRVILSTNIAETSLTVPGVRAVVDSTQQRHASFDVDSGMTQLGLTPVSQASLTQRMGRAGREAEGRCYRCCSAQDEARRPAFLPPELSNSDITPWLPLLIAVHGAELAEFPWLESPSHDRMTSALATLRDLGWLNDRGGLNGKGSLLADVPCHPRLATLCLHAASQQALGLGCELAAILSEKDLYRRERKASPPGGVDDVAERWVVWNEAQTRGPEWCRRHGVDIQAVQAIKRTATQLRQATKGLGDPHQYGQDPEGLIPRLVLAAYPDRVGVRQDERSNRIQLCGGVGAELAPPSGLIVPRGRTAERLVVAAQVQGLRGGAGVAKKICVRAACQLTESDLEAVCDWTPQWQASYRYDHRRGRVVESTSKRYRDVTLAFQEGGGEAGSNLEALSSCLAQGLLAEGDSFWSEQPEAHMWIRRLHWLHRHHLSLAEQEWPVPDSDWLLGVLLTACHGLRERREVLQRELIHDLMAALGYDRQREFDQLAPAQVTPPRGRPRWLKYDPSEAAPRLAIKVQDCFGWPESPTVLNGAQAVCCELLAPNQRPAAITDDLSRFWREGWSLVRKDLRGRYPKHDWPELPSHDA